MNEDTPIRILLVDDHNVVRKGIGSLLSTPRFRIEIVGDATNGIEAIEQNRKLRPDVILMDLEMPRMGGLEAIAEIRRDYPETRILVLTSFDELDRAKEAIQAGAMGFLLKDSSTEDLVQAVRTVYQGQVLLPPDMAAQLIGGASDAKPQIAEEGALTGREKDILHGLVRGLSNREIASELSISANTVRSHIRSILKKLDVANRTQAAMYALEHDLLKNSHSSYSTDQDMF